MNYQGVHAFYDGKKKYRYVPFDSKAEKDEILEKRCNKIMPAAFINEAQPSYKISRFLKEITAFIRWTFDLIHNMANQYMEAENKRIEAEKTREKLIEKGESITTILGKLHFDTNNARQLAELITAVTQFSKYKKVAKDNKDENSFYSNGLYYSSVYHEDEFRHSSVLDNYEINYTPEIMLIDIASKALVIGISATSEVPSIKNFNYEFVRKALGKENFYKISEEDKCALEEDYLRKTKGYVEDSGIKTRVEKIKVCEDPVNVKLDLEKLYFGKEEVSEQEIKKARKNNVKEFVEIGDQLVETINDNIENGAVIYDYNRLRKVWAYIAKVMKLWKEEKVISNGIIVTQKAVKDKDIDYSKDMYTLENVKLGALYAYAGLFDTTFLEAARNLENMFISITAGDFKNDQLLKEKNDIFSKKFKKDKLVFMMTTYASVGRGNNLQVYVEESEVKNRLASGKLIKVNDWDTTGFMDWDSIYIEKPTHLLPTLSRGKIGRKGYYSNSNYEGKLEKLIIVEELYARYQLDRYRKKRILGELFTAFNVGEDQEVTPERYPYYNSLYALQDVKNHASAIVYQTIGRISRTNSKKAYNAIFYDENILYNMEIDKSRLKIPVYTREFDAFLKALNEENQASYEELVENSDKDFSNQNERMHTAITSIVEAGSSSNGWNSDMQEFWSALRKLVLKYPVITSEQLKEEKSKFNNLKTAIKFGFNLEDAYYMFDNPKKKYFYGNLVGSADNDFQQVLVTRDNKVNSRPSRNYPYEVSAEDSRLQMVLNKEFVRDYWIKNEYNLDWETPKSKGKSGIICPVVYNNIYKGALGEEVVKAAIEKDGFVCEEITEPRLYEKFDFVIHNNGKTVYVDAKNYSNFSLAKEYANEELEEKVMRKIEEVDCDHALIINIIDETGSRKIMPKSKVTFIPGLFECRYLGDCADMDYIIEGQSRMITALEFVRNILR